MEMTGEGGVELELARGPEEAGVAEGEDAAVGGHEPVAVAGGRGRHAHDRLVQPQVAGRPGEGGVAEGEDAAVTGDEPVAPGGRAGGGQRSHSAGERGSQGQGNCGENTYQARPAAD